MATAPKIGARNDLDALKNARRIHAEAATKIETALRELHRMRESAGRPDYTHISIVLSNLALDLSKASKHLEEMWVLRQVAGQPPDAQLEDRIAFLEAQIESLTVRMEAICEPLYPTAAPIA